MNKKTQRLFAVILAVLMILSLLIALIPSAHAVTQEQIDALKAERDAIEAQKAEKQAVVDDLEARQESILEIKHALDERNEYTMQQIRLTEQEIELYEQMIQDKAAELEEAIRLEEQQLERYRTRVRAMEENGDFDFLALLLNTTDLGELLTAVDDIGEIMESDRRLEDEYIATRENTERVKAEYEVVKADLQSRQKALREERLELERQIQEATDHINELLEEIQQRQAEIDELDEKQQAQQEEIDKLVAELERQREEEERRRKEEEERRRQQQQQQAQNTGGVTASGSFGWPCPSCYYITSRAGNRFHPIFNEWRYHSGLDIGAQYGAAIVASDSGTVCLCGENGGYGNCIMIDHGNGYYTLYGHMSSFAVSNGDAVTKGQTIGYVGSTGWSTGPHLHFEIRYGSTCLDPETAGGFTGLTYAPDAGE